MKQNKLVIQRFQQLRDKAEAILAAKVFDFQADDGSRYHKIDQPEGITWGTSVLSLLDKVFGRDSVHYSQFKERFDEFTDWESQFARCEAVFLAAKDDYEGGYLFNMKALVQAEVFDDALEHASELLAAGYKDPACVVAGVTLETTLKQLCTREGIAHGKADRMNADLCKAGIYNTGMQKQVTAWLDRRNNAAHGNWNEYSAPEVDDMIKGVTRLIGDYL